MKLLAAFLMAGCVFGQVGIPQGYTATMQNAATANGNGTVLNTRAMSFAVMTVNCATCSGGTLIIFEGTEDGTNYTSLFRYR